MAATINLCGCRAPWAAVAACQSHTSPLLRRQYGRRAISTNTVAAAAAADQPQAAALGRRSLLHTLAAGAALLSAAQLAVPAPAAAADAEQVFASCAGCVAAISVLAAVGAAPATEQQLGSGIVWDALGHVVTPYAPVTRALRQAPGAQILVALTAADGSRHQLAATVVAKDPSRELLVLAVVPPAAGLQPIAAGSSAGLRVGQDAFLLGALPGGAPPSITTGVISAVGRVIPASNNQALQAVQTDAEVDQQSLGGALLDSSGRLVGMPVVSYVKPGQGRSSGVNFALPVDLLRDAVPKLIVYGSAQLRR